MKEVLLDVKHATKLFPIKKWFFEKQRYIHAMEDVSFQLYKGETLGIVGESGCGKSTLARTILRLIQPTGGEAVYNGEDLFKLSRRQLRSVRRHIQIVFQDPYSSLHPRMRIGDIIKESMIVTGSVKGREAMDKRMKELIQLVGLDHSYADRYPHEFSGGQRQRIVIARALATMPELLVCDEPVSALDVSVRAQILNLLEELQEELGLTYIFISHDLSVVEHICDRVIIMYLGQIVEVGQVDQIFDAPAHPYTKALLSAIPSLDTEENTEHTRIILEGDIPSPADPPEGCRFRTRCIYATEQCKTRPCSVEVAPGHSVACHIIKGEQV